MYTQHLWHLNNVPSEKDWLAFKIFLTKERKKKRNCGVALTTKLDSASAHTRGRGRTEHGPRKIVTVRECFQKLCRLSHTHSTDATVQLCQKTICPRSCEKPRLLKKKKQQKYCLFHLYPIIWAPVTLEIVSHSHKKNSRKCGMMQNYKQR